ncbi:MAG TPA: HAMP domain-containing sensor histidine kinase, partial [Rubricoccaceae bacterium]|nr:HAMP domain-containing sensor histidine kinase [Rubricoccaceae bacterium]
RGGDGPAGVGVPEAGLVRAGGGDAPPVGGERDRPDLAPMAEVLNGLRAAQDRLVQQEKMASLGRLTAGIAHEIKNPLNFVNNFAALSGELVDELDAALANREGRPPEAVRAEVEGVLADLRQDVAKIREHGERADAIVRGMLEHARTQRGTPQRTDLNALVEEHVEAACAHFADRHDGFEAALDMDLDAAVGAVAVVPQEISRVVAGLVNNALYAVRERARAVSMGDGAGYVPAVTVRTGRAGERVRIEVADNGVGIPAAAREHVFEPFFTTKPAGEGTGLGLSLAYDLITHGHGGALTFESEEGRGTTFTVTLPAPPLAHEVQVSEAAAFA